MFGEGIFSRVSLWQLEVIQNKDKFLVFLKVRVRAEGFFPLAVADPCQGLARYRICLFLVAGVSSECKIHYLMVIFVSCSIASEKGEPSRICATSEVYCKAQRLCSHAFAVIFPSNLQFYKFVLMMKKWSSDEAIYGKKTPPHANWILKPVGSVCWRCSFHVLDLCWLSSLSCPALCITEDWFFNPWIVKIQVRQFSHEIPKLTFFSLNLLETLVKIRSSHSCPFFPDQLARACIATFVLISASNVYVWFSRQSCYEAHSLALIIEI